MDDALQRIGARSILVLATAIITTLSFSACGPSPDTMIDEAKALSARFEEAFNNEDIDALAACYWDDPAVLSMPPGNMVVKGHEGIRADFKAFLEGTNVKRFKLRKPQYRVVGDSVIGWGKFRLTTLPSIGPEVTIDGRYLEVIEKKNGEWVYVLDHASVPMPPNTGEAPGESTKDKKKDG